MRPWAWVGAKAQSSGLDMKAVVGRERVRMRRARVRVWCAVSMVVCGCGAEMGVRLVGGEMVYLRGVYVGEVRRSVVRVGTRCGATG